MAQKISLKSHQKQIVLKTKKHAKGRIQAPTGVGKTYAQAEVVRLALQSGFSITLVKSPRISLSNQLANEYADYIDSVSKNKLAWHKLLVHSGESLDFEPDQDKSEDELFEDMQNWNSSIDATTSVLEIRRRVLECQKLDIPMVIFTTYHSNEKVAQDLNRLGIKVSLDINDEAHYLVREDFNNILDLYKPKRQYFFTATEKHTESDLGRGMNNESKFGKQLYNLSVQKAIDLGLILPIHPICIKSHDTLDQETLDANIGDVVMEAYRNIQIKFPSLGSKMLVATRGSKQIEALLESIEFQMLLDMGVNILTVHSRTEYITHNGEQITRSEFDRLKVSLGSDLMENLIIVHYDILSEGIDIPGLLGVLILRKMGEAKFLQTIGRALRVMRSNAKLKPYGLVMFPDICDPDMSEYFQSIMLKLRDMGYTSSEKINELLALGQSEEEEDNNFIEPTRFDSLSSNMELRLYSESIDLSAFASI